MTRRPTGGRKRKTASAPTRSGKDRAASPHAELNSTSKVALCTGEVVHRTDGRLRVKIPAKKGDATFFAAVAEKFAKCRGVERVEVNPVTSSVLFVHSTAPDRIERFAAEKRLFRLAPCRPVRKTLFGDVADLFRNWNRGLKQSTGGGLDIPSLIFLSLVASGIYQVARGNLVMPAWYTAFYYALGIFSRSYDEAPDEGENIMDDLEESGDFVGDFGEGGDD